LANTITNVVSRKLISELNASYTPPQERLRQAAAALSAAKIGADGEKARQALIEVIK
jgi:hypothetical protein